MKKFVSLMLALVMMLSVAAIAEEAVPSPVVKVTIGSFTPEGITPAVVSAEDAPIVNALLSQIIAANDNEAVFKSAEVEGINNYELIELVGLTLADYDESMGDVTLNIKFAASFAQDAKLLALVGLILPGETEGQSKVVWTANGVQSQIEADGSITFTFAAALAKEIANGTAVLAILQEKA